MPDEVVITHAPIKNRYLWRRADLPLLAFLATTFLLAATHDSLLAQSASDLSQDPPNRPTISSSVHPYGLTPSFPEDELSTPAVIHAPFRPVEVPVTSLGVVEDWRVASEQSVPRFRKQFFQGAELRAGHLIDLGGGSPRLSQTFEDVRVAFGVPLFSMSNLLALQPYFRVDQLHGVADLAGAGIEAPETLYNTGVSLFFRKTWSPKWSATLLLTPSVRSDFETSRDAFRLFGLGIASWQATPSWSFSFGAVYLDRADLGLLPVLGATWTPTPRWKWDLTMPRPRVSYRQWKQGADAEAWLYMGGELAGNTWAVRRTSGAVDELSLGGIDLVVGYEQIRAG
ncbi:MAG: DUF6268 family outer membrane beta-barrel protein, partial [Planctomycetota bacterium]